MLHPMNARPLPSPPGLSSGPSRWEAAAAAANQGRRNGGEIQYLPQATSQASKSDDDAYELRTRATYEQRSSVPRETPYKRVSRAKSALLLRFQTGDALLETQ